MQGSKKQMEKLPPGVHFSHPATGAMASWSANILEVNISKSVTDVIKLMLPLYACRWPCPSLTQFLVIYL